MQQEINDVNGKLIASEEQNKNNETSIAEKTTEITSLQSEIKQMQERQGKQESQIIESLKNDYQVATKSLEESESKQKHFEQELRRQNQQNEIMKSL